jgi:hypothetical protein
LILLGRQVVSRSTIQASTVSPRGRGLIAATGGHAVQTTAEHPRLRRPRKKHDCIALVVADDDVERRILNAVAARGSTFPEIVIREVGVGRVVGYQALRELERQMLIARVEHEGVALTFGGEMVADRPPRAGYGLAHRRAIT